jgi:predicted dehydrogenase
MNQSTLSWFYEYWEPTYTAEIQNFVDAVAGSAPLTGANLIDGYKAVEWALAAKRAVDDETIIKIQ